MTAAGWLRSDHAHRLTRGEGFDVVVIGGGITGAGAALDLAARGFEVAVVERTDFAQGTSSRSTKLFHGGIRYLPQFHFGLVAEGLREQKVLARVADFLYRPLEFAIPLYDQHGLAGAPAWAARGWTAPLALRAGLTLYDLLGGIARPGGRHRALGAPELLAAFPTLRPEGLRGGFVYSDAQTDDARLVVTVLKTAVARYGATAVNGVEVDRVERDGDGFVVRAVCDGEEIGIRARAVLTATGAFDPPRIDAPGQSLRMVRSKGTHLLVPRDVIGVEDRAVVLPETDDGRVLYVVPWLGHAMIGTTDTPYTGDPAHPAADPEDVDYLIRHVRRYLDTGEFQPLSTFAGLRALKDTGGGSTAEASREHVIEERVPGMVQVAGGKLTTYRRIAAEAADAVARALRSSTRSATDTIPLVGAGTDPADAVRALGAAGARPSVIAPTVDRYGGDAIAVAELMAADPGLAEPLGDGRSSLADVVHAVRDEGAGRIGDVTLRRTRLAWFTPDHGRADAERIAARMAIELGWSPERTRRELDAHEAELVAEGL